MFGRLPKLHLVAWKTSLLVAAALSTAQPAAAFELTDYLLGADLIVSGRVVVLGNVPVISVAIDSVLAGVAPSDTIHLNTGTKQNWPAGSLQVGAFVLGHATYEGARHDTCAGNVWVVDRRGGLILFDSDTNDPPLLGGRPLDDPGSYTRLLGELDRQRKKDHAVESLEGAQGLALVALDWSRSHGGFVPVHFVRWVVGGAPGQVPGVRKLRLKRGCELVKTGTDTLLIPIKTSTAVVELRPCRDDVRLRGGTFRPLGLPGSRSEIEAGARTFDASPAIHERRETM